MPRPALRSRSALRRVVLVGFLAALLCSESAPANFDWSGPFLVDRYHGIRLTAVACPAPQQCTGVDAVGQEVTFDPGSPGTPTAISINRGQGLLAIACPTVRQCTAVGGGAVTFDPL